MTPFLKLVAEDLLQRCDNDLSRVAVVFPNKRASIFFNEYLAPKTEDGEAQPIWSPVYMTINELFGSLSTLQVADPIETICHLHKLYVKALHLDEDTQSEKEREKRNKRKSLDFFYGWGERLLADFDDVDKNMADPEKLFSNLAAIKNFGEADFLEDEQKKALSEFFRDFKTEGLTQLRHNFAEIWDVLFDIYKDLNNTLAKQNQAYEGALYRRVVEGLESGSIALPDHIDTYVFVGFNVLDKVEETLFAHLQKLDKALFYWDYDCFYLDKGLNAEAGTFLRSNLQKFPNALDAKYFDNLRHIKSIEFVSAATENIQARAVAPWLDKHLTTDARETAVVLCNESLLEPIIHALPDSVKEANITKGYPLHHTMAYHLVEKESADIAQVKNNLEWIDHLTQKVKEAALKLEQTGIYKGNDTGLDKTLNTEAYFQTYTTLNRFHRLVADGLLNVSVLTLSKLLRQELKRLSIPFHGEPAAGLQVMGVLETRCLDFRNILLLSVNEGNLPKRVEDSSFIPLLLRREFGLTIPLRKTAVYAYYFYRLIQRAEHVRMIYNCSENGTGTGTGEMSRFMTQLLIESNLPIKHFALTSKQAIATRRPQSIKKPADIATRFKSLSPSAINDYFRCQLLFFFRKILRLKTPQDVANIIEPNTLGTIFHRAAELLYIDIAKKNNGTIPASALKFYHENNSADATLTSFVRRAIQEETNSNNPIIEATIKSFLKNLISNKGEQCDFELYATEEKHYMPLKVNVNGTDVELQIGGFIDRMDIVHSSEGDYLRIVDYKTGQDAMKVKDIDALFTPGKAHPHYELQVLIYALVMQYEMERWKLMTIQELDSEMNAAQAEAEKTGKEADHQMGQPQKLKHVQAVKPTLFFVNKASAQDYSSDIVYGKNELSPDVFNEIADDFKKKLVELVAEILDSTRSFAPTEVVEHCDKCDFRKLCYN
ncbi:MAG: PD-(D/E)XK nuclease family protein [Bacteroidales bacterium]|nr:PD-(D/E)XK nuclease family protein [Bacteroidales bacterium]